MVTQTTTHSQLPGAVRALYPFDGKTLSVGGHALHYLDEGRGEPLLMVHGNPTWSFYFRGLVLGLRDRYRCVVPDHIGCGLSARPRAGAYPYTLQRRVDDLEALADHLGLEKLTLVVHDWGGMIGMAFAARNPDRVKRLIVTNTAAFRLPAAKPLPWQIKVCRDTGPVGRFLVQGLNAFSRGAVLTCTTRRKLAPAERAGYLAPYDTWHNRRAVLQFVKDIPLTAADESYALVKGVEDRLGAFRGKPMLVCWGAKDFVFDDHFLAGWRERFPEAEVHRFADAGHYVLEDVGPEILALARDFLTRTDQ